MKERRAAEIKAQLDAAQEKLRELLKQVDESVKKRDGYL